MSRISHYLYDNYSRKLTLSEIAEKEHLSVYHLSHIIKQSTGLSFKELLSFIRVEESEKHLLGSDMSVIRIAEAVGFFRAKIPQHTFLLKGIKAICPMS